MDARQALQRLPAAKPRHLRSAHKFAALSDFSCCFLFSFAIWGNSLLGFDALPVAGWWLKAFRLLSS